MYFRLLARQFGVFVTIWLCLVGVAYAPTERAEAGSYPNGNTIVIYAINPAGATLTLNVTSNNIEEYTASSSDTAVFWMTPSLGDGYHVVRVTQAGGGLIHREGYSIGESIVDTGFRDLVIRVLGREWVSATILFALAIGAIKLGRFAGVPIMMGGVTVLAVHEYNASWIMAVLVFPSALSFAYVLYKASGGDT